MASHLPSLFISHGPPTLVIDDLPVCDFLRTLGRSFEQGQKDLRAILCVSAHWITRGPTVGGAAWPDTIHDFHGFPRALYEISYPAPGHPGLANRIVDLLESAGWSCDLDESRGLDHGAWQPLMIAFPEADVPVLQLSLQATSDMASHFRLGQALAPLREEGVLIVGSGTATHNLARWRDDKGELPDWAQAFDNWLADTLEQGNWQAAVEPQSSAPDFARAHPTIDHYLPLLVAMGAGAPDHRGRALHRSFAYGSLSMAAYAFGEA